MPVGKGSIERAVKAKNAGTKPAEEKKAAVKVAPAEPAKVTAPKASKPKKASAKKAEPALVQESVIAATSPEVLELVTGKRQEKPVHVGEQMPDWLL